MTDTTSTPSEVVEKGVKIGGQATENWSLLRLLPVLIGEKITDTDDPVWKLTVQLKELVEFICAPQISVSSCFAQCPHCGVYRDKKRDVS